MRLSTARVPKSGESTAQRKFRSLPVSAPDRPVDPSTKRICLVTEEIAGPDFNGGIGTANKGLALALRAEGYQVDVLYTRVDEGQPFCFRGTFADQVTVFRDLGLRLWCIRHDGQWNDWLAKSYRALEHLVRHPYDLVFFNDCRGTAYYPLLSRRTGDPRLAGTIMCVVAHSSTQWIAEINEQSIASIDDLRVIELERRSIELADTVISPSAYLLRKYHEYGWELPKETFVQPNILHQELRPTSTPTGRRVAVEELVFFGRLETRKGLWIFFNIIVERKGQMTNVERNENRARSTQVAKIILSQIETGVKMSLGAHSFSVETNALVFKVGSGRDKVRGVKVTLNGGDTYDVEFIRIDRKYEAHKEVHNDIYAENLNELLLSFDRK